MDSKPDADGGPETWGKFQGVLDDIRDNVYVGGRVGTLHRRRWRS